MGGSLRTCSSLFFGLGAAAAAACLLLLLPTTSVLKQREMVGTSIAAVVLGCFYFCPSDCDASALVVDCAAVMTGCMLEKIIKRLQRNTCYILIFWSR